MIANRLHSAFEADPYYPHKDFPKLTTPQWVGEEGVEGVVVLAVDDMRDPAKYETFLRPILDRLKAIDGRAPVSIMTNQVDPNDPRLQGWLKEGLSIEVHTIAHPCPFLHDGDFEAASRTYHDGVDLLSKIPNNQARRVSDAVLRLDQLAEPPVLRRALQQDEPRTGTS